MVLSFIILPLLTSGQKVFKHPNYANIPECDVFFYRERLTNVLWCAFHSFEGEAQCPGQTDDDGNSLNCGWVTPFYDPCVNKNIHQCHYQPNGACLMNLHCKEHDNPLDRAQDGAYYCFGEDCPSVFAPEGDLFDMSNNNEDMDYPEECEDLMELFIAGQVYCSFQKDQNGCETYGRDMDKPCVWGEVWDSCKDEVVTECRWTPEGQKWAKSIPCNTDSSDKNYLMPGMSVCLGSLCNTNGPTEGAVDLLSDCDRYNQQQQGEDFKPKPVRDNNYRDDASGGTGVSSFLAVCISIIAVVW